MGRQLAPYAVTPAEAASILGVSRAQVYNWVNDGRLLAFEYRGMKGLRIRTSDLFEMVDGEVERAQSKRDGIRRELRMVGGRGG